MEICQHLLITDGERTASDALQERIEILLMENSEEELRLIVIDPERKMLRLPQKTTQMMCPVINDIRMGLAAIQKVKQLIMERYRNFAGVGANNLTDYNQRALPSLRIPPIVIAIADYDSFLQKAPKMFEEGIRHIARFSKAAGIYLYLAGHTEEGRETLKNWLGL